MTTTKRGKSAKAALARRIIAGTKKYFPNGAEVLRFGGTTRTVDEVTTLIGSFVELRDAVETAKAAQKAKLAAERAQQTALLAFIDLYEAFVRIRFGDQADVLAEFGLQPPRPRTPMTAEAKAIAAAKREATRAARGIVSKKARRRVRGDVTVKLVVTPAPDT